MNQSNPEEQKHSIYDATINDIADQVHRNALAHGFHPPEQALEDWHERMINNCHDELSELHEALRSGTENDLCDKAEKMKELHLPPLTKMEEEYADLIIRLLDQSRRLKLDIARAVAIKHLYNVTRPFKHGRKH